MNVCRTCVSSTCHELVSIFNLLGDQFIANVIADCSSVEIIEDDGLPSYVCKPCLKKVQMIADFVAQVHESDRKLRQLFKSEVLLRDIEQDRDWGVDSKPADLFSTSYEQIKLEIEIEKVEQSVESELELDFEDGNDSDWNEGNQLQSEGELETVETKREPKDQQDFAKDEVTTKRTQRRRKKDEDMEQYEWLSDLELDFEDGNDSDWNEGNQLQSEGELETVETKRKSKDQQDFAKDEVATKRTKRQRTKRRRKKDEDQDDDDDEDNMKDEALTEKEQKYFETIQIDPARHICCWCCMDFQTKDELVRHGEIHFNTRAKRSKMNKEHCCAICFVGFKRLKSLENHVKMAAALSNRKIYQCKLCQTRFIAPKRRRLHVMHHEKDAEREAQKEIQLKQKTPKCCSWGCYKEFESEQELLEHGQKEHSDKKRETLDPKWAHECPVCFKCFDSAKSLYRHRNRIHGAIETTCSICGIPFRCKNSAVKHERIHRNEKPHECQICGKRFISPPALRDHMLVHNDEKPFVCSVCGWSFKRECNLRIHVLIHSDSLPFKCTVCEKSFKGKYHLQYHMRTHTGAKPYKCQFCDKAFAHHENRKRHEISHTGIKPHKCSYCEKGFIRKRQLVEHESTHTGIEPYNCEMCNRRFGTKPELQKHLEVHPKASENQLSLPPP